MLSDWDYNQYDQEIKMDFLNKILPGNCKEVLKTLPDKTVRCCVTSPPYFNLRNYDHEEQIGMEDTPAEFIKNLVDVFEEVKRILTDDGTIWVNIGDSYAANGKNRTEEQANNNSTLQGTTTTQSQILKQKNKIVGGLKSKDLIGIPWMLAFALRSAGWYLRQDIIWCLSGGAWLYVKSQKGIMPMMVRDMCRLKPETIQLWNGDKWTQVIGYNKTKKENAGIEIVLRSGERVGCTQSHIWPTQRGNIKASDLVIGDVISHCKLPDSKVDVPEYLTKEVMWFVGLYLAEGSMSDGTIQIAGHTKETTRLDKIKEITKHYGGHVFAYTKGNSTSINVNSLIISAILNQYISGRIAKNKCLNPVTWELSSEYLKEIVTGYLSGDAHNDIQNNRHRLGFCRNYNLERDLRILAARLDATLTLKPTFSTNKGKRFASFKGEWRWSVSNHFNNKNRFEVIEIRKSRAREFWHIGVQDEPHLFSLSSGALTHNSKPNPMPESVTDRCTKSHEYIFLLSKSNKYFYDADAIKVEAKDPEDDARRITQQAEDNKSMPDRLRNGLRPKNRGHQRPHNGFNSKWDAMTKEEQAANGANKRSVWTVCTKPYSEAHFATFPPELIIDCIKAGSEEGDLILDPFMGAGTTGMVAKKLNRNFVGIELNPKYIAIAEKRLDKELGMFRNVVNCKMISDGKP